MVFAEDPLPVGENLLQQRNSPGQVPGSFVGSGEVAASGWRAGVVFAEYSHVIGEGLVVQGDGAA